MNRDEVRYLEYQSIYRNSLVELLSRMWSILDLSKVEQRFSWRYEQNYCLRENTLFIAVAGDRVVGFRGYTAQKYCFHGEIHIVLTPSDAIVHPDYRRKGVFDHLMKLSLKSIAVNQERLSLSLFLNLSSNEQSTPAYIKHGWRVLASKDFYSRISIPSLIKRTISIPRYTKWTLKSGSSEISVSIDIDTSLIRNIMHFVNYPIQLDRSDEYFTWRYLDSGESINFVAFSISGSLHAYMIIKHCSKHLGLIVDYSAKSSLDLRKMMALSSRALGYSVMRVRISGGACEERVALRKSGFILDTKVLSMFKHKKKPPVLLKCVDPNNHDHLINGIDVMNSKNWRLLSGESH